MSGLESVEEFHKRYPGKPGTLEHVLGGPPTSERHTVTSGGAGDRLKDCKDQYRADGWN